MTLLRPAAALILLVLLTLAAEAQPRKPADTAAGQCSNNRRDGTETDIDCGGQECSRRCSLKQHCKQASDCQSSTCDLETKRCACPAGMLMHGPTLTCRSEQTTCYNGKRDGKEADIDCGGPCPQLCGLSMRCKSSADCRSGFCNTAASKCGCPPGQTLGPDKRKCIPATQHIQGAVKDVTPASIGQPPACAVNGSKCAVGQQCRINQDCRTGSCDVVSRRCGCAAGFVQAPNNAGCVAAGSTAGGGAVFEKAAVAQAGVNRKDPCWNGVKDGTESDIDCGGTTCWKCALGKSCRQASDCSSLTCDSKSKTCVCAPGTSVSRGGDMCMPQQTVVREGADQCFNGRFDQGEADVDCGGVCKIGCKFGSACKANTDCAAGECNKDQRICMCPRGQYISPDSSACLTEADLCFNGAKDAEESDVDCGGVCAAKCKFNQVCDTNSDCESRVCNANTKLCGCPKGAPLSKDGSKCLTECDKDVNPCKNGGTCEPTAGATVNLKCACPPNFVGDLCETRVNTCNVTNPCRNGGACIPTPGWTPGKSGPDFRCYCKAGYSGAMCEVAKSSCFAAASICRNGGTCVPLPGEMPDFRCNCTKGWAGLTCNTKGSAAAATTQDVCQVQKPCQNGGTCTAANISASAAQQGQYTCTCPAGFSGQDCEVVDDDYDSGALDASEDTPGTADDGSYDDAYAAEDTGIDTPASNSAGDAITTGSTANITVGAGSAGTPTNATTCDRQSPCRIGDCEAKPGADPDYACVCPEGYSGQLCEIKQNTCEYFNPCENGGKCEAKPVDDYADYSDGTAPVDYTCKCADGFSGQRCETGAGAAPTPAPGVAVTATPVGGGVTVTTGTRTSCTAGNPCRNGGTCTPQQGSIPDYTCTCAPGFSGSLCETKLSTCSLTNPCGNNGTCLPNPGSSPDFRCSCTGGFAGALCEIDCYALSQVPDSTGRTCIDGGDLISAISTGSDEAAPADMCGRGAPRKCVPGEPCRTAEDCQEGECKVFPALDNVPRCVCPQNSFIFLKEGEWPKCVSQAEMCSNGVRDVYEGDVDCGFYCGKLCGLGQACKGSYGCASGFCNLGTQRCDCQSGFVAAADGRTCAPKT